MKNFLDNLDNQNKYTFDDNDKFNLKITNKSNMSCKDLSRRTEKEIYYPFKDRFDYLKYLHEIGAY